MTTTVVDADQFVLSGRGVDVQIAPTLAGGPQLRYHAGTDHRDFTKDEITIEQSPIGTWYTVTIAITVDVGSTTFSVLVPTVRITPGGSAPVRTVGVTTVHKTPFAPPAAIGQTENYTIHTLRGTATFIET